MEPANLQTLTCLSRDCHLESWTGRFTLLAIICIVLRFYNGASSPRRELHGNDLLQVLCHSICPMFKHSEKVWCFSWCTMYSYSISFPCICGQFKVSPLDHLHKDAACHKSQLWLQQEEVGTVEKNSTAMTMKGEHCLNELISHHIQHILSSVSHFTFRSEWTTLASWYLHGRCVAVSSLCPWQPVIMVHHRTWARGSVASKTAVKLLWQRGDPWTQVGHHGNDVFLEKAKCKIIPSIQSTAGKSQTRRNWNFSLKRKGGNGFLGRRDLWQGIPHVCTSVRGKENVHELYPFPKTSHLLFLIQCWCHAGSMLWVHPKMG